MSRSLAIVNGAVYGVTASLPSAGQNPPSTIYAWRARDGTLLWQDQASYFASPAVIIGGTVYVASGDGTPLWQWHYPLGYFPFLSMAADAVEVSVVILDRGFRTGTLYRLQGSTGSLLWHYQASTSVFALEEIKGVIYVAALDGTLSVLRASDGMLLWSRRFEGTGFQETMSDGTPFLLEGDNGMLFLRSQDAVGTLYALRARDGALLWHYAPGRTSSPSTPVGTRS